ncbi:MAG: PSD1 and planctomycete cytochrome C domain-containing protein [Planctomycetota bacterium]
MFLVLATLSTLASQTIDDTFFENRIRPVLTEHCGKCHGVGDGAKVKGGLRLDSRKSVLAGGDNGPAIVPGDPAKSRLVAAVEYLNADLQMPPKGKLPAKAISDIREWVAGGAPWPVDSGDNRPKKEETFDIASRKSRHWAWNPLLEPAIPGGSGTSIDRLLEKGRAESGIKAAPKADRRTLLRRLSFDLTGMPPTPAEAEAFASDKAPDALEKQVDRLLSSPRFAEHWARHWLDLVRYAETRGHEFDFPIPNAWQYRDYVIRALDADVPYDRFAREHIAGDLIADPRRNQEEGFNESVLGTGFFFLGEEVHSPVDVRQDQADRIDNRIDVLGKTFLGLTIACARCHDHKFDAISTSDYYALYGILESSHYRQARFDTLEAENALAKRLWQARESQAKGAGNALAARLAQLADDWPRIAGEAKAPDHPLHVVLKPPTTEASAKATILVDYSRLPDGGWLPDGPRFGNGPVPVGAFGPGPDGLMTVNTRAAARRDRFWPAPADAAGCQGEPGGLSFARAGRTLFTPAFRIGPGKIHLLMSGKGHVRACIGSHVMLAGPLHGEMARAFNNGAQFRWFRMSLERYQGLPCHIEFTSDDPGAALAMVVEGDDPGSATPAAPFAADPVALLKSAATRARSGKPLTDSPGEAAFLSALVGSPMAKSNEVGAALAAWNEAEKGLQKEIPGPSRLAPACLDGTGMNEHVFVRGSPRAAGPVVPRRYLEALDGAPLTGSGSGRLELARKMTDPALSPLVPRVIANRIWHHMMGRGLIASVDNLGELGDRFANPSHGELLDHMALALVADGWSLKRAIRRVALSDAYAMSSRPAPASAEKDPGNLLFHSARIRRLSGESLRDTLLALSGRLDEKRFGPPVPPYLTPFQDGRGKPGSGPLDGNGRRSIYLGVRRNFLSSWMLAFDTPNPFSTVGRRTVSNVPAQALVLLNDPLVRQLSRLWAEREAKAGADDAAAARSLLSGAYSRAPSAEDVADALAFIADRLREPGTTREEALSLLAHALINTKEFAYVR